MSFKVGDLVSVPKHILDGNMPSGLKDWVRQFPNSIFRIRSIKETDSLTNYEYRLDVLGKDVDIHPTFFFAKELVMATPDWD